MGEQAKFSIEDDGTILFGLEMTIIGALQNNEIKAVVGHDDQTLREFRYAVITLYKECPTLESEVLQRLGTFDLEKIEAKEVQRFMRAIMPISNLNF